MFYWTLCYLTVYSDSLLWFIIIVVCVWMLLNMLSCDLCVWFCWVLHHLTAVVEYFIIWLLLLSASSSDCCCWVHHHLTAVVECIIIWLLLLSTSSSNCCCWVHHHLTAVVEYFIIWLLLLSASSSDCCCWVHHHLTAIVECIIIWLLLLSTSSSDCCCWVLHHLTAVVEYFIIWLLLLSTSSSDCCCWVHHHLTAVVVSGGSHHASAAAVRWPDRHAASGPETEHSHPQRTDRPQWPGSVLALPWPLTLRLVTHAGENCEHYISTLEFVHFPSDSCVGLDFMYRVSPVYGNVVLLNVQTLWCVVISLAHRWSWFCTQSCMHGIFGVKASVLKRHDQFVAFYFYCKIMLISIISYKYCSVLTTNKCFIETEPAS